MESRSKLAGLVAVLLVAVSTAVLADDWPQWGGPNRDAVSKETGLLKAWPEGGPTLLWTASGCGAGYGSPSVAAATIYLTGDFGYETAVVAFGLDGTQKWKTTYGRSHTDKGTYPGARSEPTVDGAMVYSLGPQGDLVCLDAKTGERKWGLNILQDFKGRSPDWKVAESVLIDGNNLICTPGGRDATIVALDKKTGRTIWTSKGLSDPPAYSSCILYKVGNVSMISTLTAKGLVGVDARTGQFLWRYDRPANGTASIPTPVFHDDRVFCASGYGVGGGQVQITVGNGSVSAQQTWETKNMVNHHGGYVYLDGYLYGNHNNGWSCLDWKTGEQKWFNRGVGKGSCIAAEGMLYCLNEGRGMGLVKAGPERFEMVSRFMIPGGQPNNSWAHPVIANGRLYVRHWDNLYCFDIKAK